MSALDGALRKVAAGLVKQFGQQVVLKTSAGDYSASTRTVTNTATQLRTVRGVVTRKDKRNPDGVTVTVTELLVAARELYVDGEFRLPRAGDEAVVGPTTIFGDDENPGWDGGTEYRIGSVRETWGPEEVILYTMTLER